MKHIIVFVLGTFCLGCLSGCSGQNFPSDFPKVYPMTVTVKDGTTPLSKVMIMFYPATTGAGAAYASSGSTNADGVAKVSTSQGAFNRAGIPAGEFVVTVEDIVEVDIGVTPEEETKMSMRELGELSRKKLKLMAEYERKVPDALRQSGKIENRSPIRFIALTGKNELTIDVAQFKM